MIICLITIVQFLSPANSQRFYNTYFILSFIVFYHLLIYYLLLNLVLGKDTVHHMQYLTFSHKSVSVLIIIIFIDLKNAFYTVIHIILLFKLKNIGVRGIALNWIMRYLTNIYQQCIYIMM